jgi:hypothetical protein
MTDGFDGADKIFLFEFNMPTDGNRDFNGDMPAIWLLNAQISRTQQYGGCSCWPKCGEIDIVEVLDKGSSRAKSTVHAAADGGASDYFQRPTGGTIKIAAIFDSSSNTFTARVVDANFGDNLSRGQVQGWINVDNNSASIFNIN